MISTLIEDAAVEPLDLPGLWLHLRRVEDEETTPEDPLLEEYLHAARVDVEERCGIALIEQTREVAFDRFPCWTAENARRALMIPRPPLRAVTWIHYVDLDGVTQTLDSAVYLVDTRSYPGRIVPAYGMTWPSTRDEPNAVIVRYTAGFGTTPDEVPAPIRDALRLEVANRYEHREDVLVGESPVSMGAIQQLLANYRAYVA